MERINNRTDNSFGFEKNFIRGQAKMKTRMGLELTVMMAMALGHVKAGRIEQMRSLFSRFRFEIRVKFLLRRFPTVTDNIDMEAYCLKAGSDGLFRNPALKIVKCGVSKSSKNLF